MSFLLKDAINGSLVDAIYNEIISRRSNYYYFIGRVLNWPDPQSPPAPEDTYAYELNTRNEIINVKRIQLTDVSYVIPRIDWVSGTVYDQYDGDYSTTYPSSTGATDLKSSRFYVLTSNFNVYKCLFNNNGSVSTSQPTGTDAFPIAAADDYIWKYMYTIPLSLRNRFLTNTLMPVQKSVLNAFYSNGEIDNVVIDNAGSGYSGNAEVTLTVNGEFLGGTGNSIANLVPVLNTAGQFVDVIIRDRGNNYSSANITINDTAGTGTGYYNVASVANLTPILFNGQIDRVLIEDPGIGYSSNIQTTLVLTGDGSGAELLPFINETGELEDVIITSRGSGYTYLDIEVVGDGTGANAFPQLSTGDLDTVQSTVELAAVPGALYSFRVLNRGSGYDSNTTVSVVGDGTGFVGNVVLTSSNTISHINVDNPGSGYTYANVIISGSGANAVVQPILPPQGGHGSNPVKEFFADSLLFYSTINNERIHTVDVNNDYRQFGIIKDLKQFGNTKAFANVTGTPCYLITTDTVLNSLAVEIAQDSVLELKADTTRKFEVIEVTSNNRILITNLNNYDLQVDDILTDPITSSDFTIEAINNLPTINKFSGDLLFIDNRTKVSYSDQQLVTLRTILRL